MHCVINDSSIHPIFFSRSELQKSSHIIRPNRATEIDMYMIKLYHSHTLYPTHTQYYMRFDIFLCPLLLYEMDEWQLHKGQSICHYCVIDWTLLGSIMWSTHLHFEFLVAATHESVTHYGLHIVSNRMVPELNWVPDIFYWYLECYYSVYLIIIIFIRQRIVDHVNCIDRSSPIQYFVEILFPFYNRNYNNQYFTCLYS